MSIKLKLIGLAIMAILLSAVFITAVAINSFDVALTKSQEAKLSSMIKDKSEIIHTLFHSYGELVQSLSTSKEVKDSLVDFSEGFYKIKDELDVNKNKLEADLIVHYDSEYLNKVNYKLEGTQRRLTSQYLPHSLNGKMAQNLFIIENKYPIGEKNKEIINPKYKFLTYMKMHGIHHPTFNSFLEAFGLYDIFLVNIKGDVVYTTYKEKDFATNLRRDIYKLSALGRAYFGALKSEEGTLFFEDFSYYEPSYNASASFISAPIYIDGRIEGALVFQLPIEKLNHVLETSRDNEAYLVGADLKLKTELKYRDQIQGFPVIKEANTAIGIFEMDNKFIQEALIGNKGTGVAENYVGINTVTAYAPLDIFGNTWAIVGDIPVAVATKEKDQVIKEIMTVSFITVALSIVILFTFVETLMGKPLSYIVATTQDISMGEGDLTKRVIVFNEKDEFGDVSVNMNKFIARIQGLINSVKDLGDENNSVSEKISQVSSSISERIKAENETLSLISNTGKTISSDLRDTATNIKETKEIIVDSNQILNEAKSEINNLARKVGVASENQKNLSSKLATLSEHAEKIKDVLYVIDDIADQTNLLALNAAIEAARAGEFGKGFAVVAFEVTKLADKTQESLADVNKIVTVVLDEMKDAVKLMSKSAASISELSIVSSDASRRITDTSENIDESVSIIEQTVISAISASTKTSDIIEKIQQITKLSNENMVNVIELSDTSAELHKSGEELTKALSHYRS